MLHKWLYIKWVPLGSKMKRVAKYYAYPSIIIIKGTHADKFMFVHKTSSEKCHNISRHTCLIFVSKVWNSLVYVKIIRDYTQMQLRHFQAFSMKTTTKPLIPRDYYRNASLNNIILVEIKECTKSFVSFQTNNQSIVQVIL
jgi:hypothetical protein